MADNNVANYKEQGGSRDVIGGSLDIVSGGEIDIESGGALKIAGVAVTPSAAELNIMSGVTLTAVKINKAVQSTTGGAVITGGEVVISGSTSFSTGLASVVAVTASQVSDASLTDSVWAMASKGTTAGWVIIKSFKPTASNNALPIAGSASTTFGWIAIGA